MNSSDEHYYQSRSSDWMLDHLRAFLKATGDIAWDGIRTAHQNLISTQQTKYANGTGPLPDFVVHTNGIPEPAPGKVLENTTDGTFYWNACRTS